MDITRLLMSRRSWLGAAALAASPMAAAGFVDPLDAPARTSALAAQRTLLAVARAGQRLVAVGARGHVVTSDDQGARWTQAQVPVSVDLTALHFADAQRGWAVGHGGVILHTGDGGRSWTRQADGRTLSRQVVADLEQKLAQAPGDRRIEALLVEARRNVEVGPDKPLLGVWFADARNGYVVGAYNLIFRTSDGGQRWEPWFDRTDNPHLLHLTAVGGDGATVFVVGEKGLVLRLDAAGERFEAQNTGYTGSFFALAVAPRRVLVFGMRGSAYERSEGAAGWTRREIPVQGGLNGTALLDDGRIAVVSQDGKLLLGGPEGDFKLVPEVRPAVFTAAVQAGAGRLVLVGLQGASTVVLP